MSNIMILAQQQHLRISPPHYHKRSPRPDSPGGYFTLSDSDGGASPGTESSENENSSHPSSRSTTPMYKIFKADRQSAGRSRSEPPLGNYTAIPPRPSPPQELKSLKDDEEEDPPPRPPPPLSYTSTLPPPVPKKMNKTLNKSVKKFVPPPPPPPLAFNGPKAKPLQRVQPLQIQSPSMINILQQNNNNGGGPPRHVKQNSTSSNSSDDNNSLELGRSKHVSFVKTFQKACTSSSSGNSGILNGGNSELRPRPPLKKKAELASKGYMRPTKTAVLKQNENSSKNSRNNKNCSSSCSSSSSSSSETENDKGKKKVSKKSTETSDAPTPKKSRSVKITNGKKPPKNNGDREGGKLKKLKNTVNELKRSASDKIIISSKESHKNEVKKVTEVTSEAAEVAKEVASEANIFKNPISSLIKFYEDSQVDKRKAIAAKTKELVVLEDKELENEDKRISVTSSKTSSSSGHLSQISQLSAEKIQSWFNNPMVSLEKDWSVTEVNILDQYVTDMISMTSIPPSSKPPKNRDEEIIKRNVVIDIKCEDSGQQKSVCDINSNTVILKSSENSIKNQESKIKRKSLITVIEDKTPSEEEISNGVFTEVSYAGNVSQKKIDLVKSHFESTPVPSPRVKKKARKEQMLLEHKEKGREALSLAMKQLKTTNDEIDHENEEDDGLQCLDDLCTQSRYVEEDIKKQQQHQHNSKVSTKDAENDQVQQVGVKHRLFAHWAKLSESDFGAKI